jgi:hypothetical protein
VLGRLGRWTIELVVFLFALYAFAFVPLGKRTGLDHLRAILGTPEAQEAGEEMLEAGDRLKQRVLGDGRPAPARGKPLLPELAPGAPPQMRVVPAQATPDGGVDASLVD